MPIGTHLEIPAWHQTSAAQAFIASIAPASMRIIKRTRVVGPDYFSWAFPEDQRRALEALRDAAAAKIVGFTFREAENNDERREFVSVWGQLPDLDDALTPRFGNPEALAAAWCFHDVDHLNRIWQAECARADAAREAA
jgi:hypothetical protein